MTFAHAIMTSYWLGKRQQRHHDVTVAWETQATISWQPIDLFAMSRSMMRAVKHYSLLGNFTTH